MTAAVGLQTSWPAAVLFDCDGTLADTEPLSERAWRSVLARYGVTPTAADFTAIIGHAWPVSFRRFADRADLGDPDEFRAELRTVSAQLHATELTLFTDAVATVRAVTDAGVPVAVVSSSSRAHVLRCLDRGRIRDRVGVVVGADDVSAHKPDPMPYLTAARELGVAAAGCTVVEDTEVGVMSARAAGAFVVLVRRAGPRVSVPGPASVAADRTVSELSPAAVVPPMSLRT